MRKNITLNRAVEDLCEIQTERCVQIHDVSTQLGVGLIRQIQKGVSKTRTENSVDINVRGEEHIQHHA